MLVRGGGGAGKDVTFLKSKLTVSLMTKKNLKRGFVSLEKIIKTINERFSVVSKTMLIPRRGAT